jgi:hypothetical protein
MAKQLYEYVVILRGKKDEDDVIVVEPSRTLAKDANHAERIALKAVDSQYDDRLEDLDVQVKPFSGR